VRKLDLRYLDVAKRSFLRYAKRDPENWYRKPLRAIVDRITVLENERAEIYRDYATVAKATSIAAWGLSGLLKERSGLEILPLNVPDDGKDKAFKTALRILPSEWSVDAANGGVGLGWYARYYFAPHTFINGIEAKTNLLFSDNAVDTLRVDIDAFHAYNNFITLGAGGSAFGNLQGKFYKREGAFGLNAYIDILDILRFSYVRHTGDVPDSNYLFIGVENIPSLIYRLTR
jgi:hypothetical protein